MTFILQFCDSLVEGVQFVLQFLNFVLNWEIVEENIYQRLGASLHALMAGFSAVWSWPLRIANAWLFYPALHAKAQHRAGEIDDPARSLLISTLSKLGFGPTERSNLKVPEKPTVSGFEKFEPGELDCREGRPRCHCTVWRAPRALSGC